VAQKVRQAPRKKKKDIYREKDSQRQRQRDRDRQTNRQRLVDRTVPSGLIMLMFVGKEDG
jgi:hypothetical protein